MASGSRSGSIAPSKTPLLEKLIAGEKFLKWTDQDSTGIPVTLKVDPNGFFLYFYNQNDEITLIDFFHIRDIRNGAQAKTPKDPKVRHIVNMGADELEDKTITVVVGTDFVNTTFINFCTHKVENAQVWSRELWEYVKTCNPLNINSSQALLKIHTQLLLQAHKPDAHIPVKSIVKFFAQDKLDRKVVEKALDSSGLPSTKNEMVEKKVFTFEKFQEFYLKLLLRDDIKRVFDDLCKEQKEEKSFMSCKTFLNFLNQYQRDPRLNEILHPYATEEKAIFFIRKYEPNIHNSSQNRLSVEGFMWYLLSEDNQVMSPEKLYRPVDMDKPLSHYFIASSHNTYLLGHQLTGRAAVEMYRQVLLSGCRCIELDFWDGEEEPIITHGYTIVNNLQAKEVIQAIGEYAFKTSDYPLILSFENHCKFKQQAKIAEYCRQYFGERMLADPLENYPLKPGVQLPSPELLKGKILIKNKKQHIHHTKSQHSPNPSTPSRKVEPRLSNGSTLDTPDDDAPTNGDDSDSDDSDDSDSEEEDSTDGHGPKELVATSAEGTAGKESKACREISELVNYVTPVRFKNFRHAETRSRAYEMSSFVETKALSHLQSDPLGFVKYNHLQMSRIYPKGTRIDSFNYYPQTFWNAGCQLVALNYQQLDIPMQLNLGIFQYNRQTGYLLKPDLMCRSDRMFDPFTESSVDGIVSGTVTIKIISGQLLTEKRVGTYVEVEMYGLPRDTVRKKFKTRTVQNGINPVFDEDPFVFRQIVMPELAVIRIAAFEESGSKLIGHRVLPIVGLCPGYRHIPLFSEAGQPLDRPSLFVMIKVGDYVPNAYADFAEALSNPMKHQKELEEERAKQLEVLDDVTDRTETDNSSSVKGVTNSDEPHQPQSPVHEIASTPEGASPTVEYLRRAGSNTKKMGSSKDGSPIIGPQRTDSNKSLPLKQEENTLKTKTFVAVKLEEILEHKAIKEKYAELEMKLDQLKKKKEKELVKLKTSKSNAEEKLSRAPSSKASTKNPLNRIGAGIKKKFSTANLESGASGSNNSDNVEAKRESLKKVHGEKELSCEKNYFLQEKELKEKYIESIQSCAEKVMSKSQSSQFNSLKSLYDQESSSVMKQNEMDFKEEAEKGSMASISKEDMQRERRERLIKKGVAAREKLNDLYNERKKELEDSYAKLSDELKEKLKKDRTEAQDQYDANLSEISSKLASLDSG